MYALSGGRNILISRIQRRNLSVSSRTVIDAANKDGELRVFIVSGEVSGDNIAARLMASLKKISPLPIRFSGVGGWSCKKLAYCKVPCQHFLSRGSHRPQPTCRRDRGMVFAIELSSNPAMSRIIESMMSLQGLNSLFPMEDIAVMGIWELLPHMCKIRARLKQTVESASLFKPHFVVTVDSKGFSFRLLKQLRAMCLHSPSECPRHFHYVAPSFWAWKGGEERLKGLAQFIDHIFCILPFEEEVCRSKGLKATFVGHPVVEDILQLKLGKDSNNFKHQGNNEDFRNKHEVSPGTTLVSVLPGSRLQEVTRMLPIYSKAMSLLKASIPELQAAIHVAPNKHVESYITSMAHQWPVPVIMVPGSATQLKYDAFSVSRAALCTSGTAAVELQLARLPCVVAYRAHILTELLIRYKAKVPYISLPNILLNSPVIPESLFQNCTPTRLASILGGLIRDEGVREQQILASEEVLRLLSPPVDRLANHCYDDAATPSAIAASTILHSRYVSSVWQ